MRVYKDLFAEQEAQQNDDDASTDAHADIVVYHTARGCGQQDVIINRSTKIEKTKIKKTRNKEIRMASSKSA